MRGHAFLGRLWTVRRSSGFFERRSKEEQQNLELRHKRKKEALGRTTSLTNVQSVVSSKTATPQAVQEDPSGKNTSTGGGDKNGDGEEDVWDGEDDLEAQLEAEMSRQDDDNGTEA